MGPGQHVDAVELEDPLALEVRLNGGRADAASGSCTGQPLGMEEDATSFSGTEVDGHDVTLRVTSDTCWTLSRETVATGENAALEEPASADFTSTPNSVYPSPAGPDSSVGRAFPW